MIDENFYFLLTNTPISYPLCLNLEQAKDYLKLILHDRFQYNNINCYDIIDYEKLFYIEITYGDNPEIAETLIEIKKSIAMGYKIKNQYKNRILDIPKTINLPKEEKTYKKQYYGIPRGDQIYE